MQYELKKKSALTRFFNTFFLLNPITHLHQRCCKKKVIINRLNAPKHGQHVNLLSQASFVSHQNDNVQKCSKLNDTLGC